MLSNYFKTVNDGYITSIGNYPNFGESITEEEYNSIKSIVDNKPDDTETHYYKLRADTLQYEAIERPEPVPVPEPTYTLDEAATILAQEVSA